MVSGMGRRQGDEVTHTHTLAGRRGDTHTHTQHSQGDEVTHTHTHTQGDEVTHTHTLSRREMREEIPGVTEAEVHTAIEANIWFEDTPNGIPLSAYDVFGRGTLAGAEGTLAGLEGTLRQPGVVALSRKEQVQK
eukprot:1189739-Prorocentrum_minimum.AAC.1